MKYLIEMPDGKHPKMFCQIVFQYGNCDRCTPKYNPCPLSNAVKAVEAGWVDEKGVSMVSTTKGNPARLFAVEEK